MARRREIDPSFFVHDGLYAAERESGLPLRVAFAGLWCHADKLGRFEWKPVQLKLGITPFDPLNFEEVLVALAMYGYIVHYQVEGRDYGVIPTFNRWQRPHPREADSRLPGDSGAVIVNHRPAKDSPRRSKDSPRQAISVGPSSLRTLKPSDPQDLGNSADAALQPNVDSEFDTAWAAYPPRPGNSKARARRAYRARRAEGVTAEAILTGVRAYAAYVARARVEPQFVKHASTFFGPDEHWLSDYGDPAEGKVWPYLNAAGEPDPEGDIPNPAFLRMAGMIQ